LAVLATPVICGAQAHRSRVSPTRHASGVTQRKRLHINDVIAAPGSVELDWAALYSGTSQYLTTPSALKFTPGGNSFFWGRTEYSVTFDSIASEVNDGSRAFHFSDRVMFAATAVVFDSEHLDVALAPQVTALLRNDSGFRIGATTIARYNKGLNDLGAYLGWSGATSATDTNPAGVWDFAAGYGRQLASSGLPSQFTLHATTQLERSTGFESNLAVFAGVEYQITPRFALDLSANRFGLTGGNPDRQLMLSLTITLGKIQ
jgi:hypothetical protein